MVIDGSEDSDRHIREMLFWDVNNGIARRAHGPQRGSIHSIERNAAFARLAGDDAQHCR